MDLGREVTAVDIVVMAVDFAGAASVAEEGVDS
jgi:hypothetical protein